ncbi:hypothetical protein CKK34_6481 [Yarrowia sp. E02]|nr:hypothetical protein CKK34_6481 [Yarrowia sp. E02]
MTPDNFIADHENPPEDHVSPHEFAMQNAEGVDIDHDVFAEEMEEGVHVAPPSRQFTEEYVTELQAGFEVIAAENTQFKWKQTQKPRRLSNIGVGEKQYRSRMSQDNQLVVYHKYNEEYKDNIKDRIKKTFLFAQRMGYMDQSETYGPSARFYIRDLPAFVNECVTQETKPLWKAWKDCIARKNIVAEKLRLLTAEMTKLGEGGEDSSFYDMILQDIADAKAELKAVEKKRGEAHLAYTSAKARVTEHYQSTAFDDVPEEPESTDDHVINTRQLKLPIVKEQTAEAKECADLIERVQLKAPTGPVSRSDLKKRLTPELHRLSSDDGHMPMLTGPDNLLNARAVKQMTGYMDTRVMCMWLRHFVKESGCTAQRPVLLVLDNVKFHHVAVKIAKQWGGDFDGLNVAFLPPASTPYTQPLDIGVMRPLKTAAKELERAYLSNTVCEDGARGQITQLHRINFLVKAWEKIEAGTIADSFSKSPAFYGNPYFTPHHRVTEQLEKFYKRKNRQAVWKKYVDQPEPPRRHGVIHASDITTEAVHRDDVDDVADIPTGPFTCPNENSEDVSSSGDQETEHDRPLDEDEDVEHVHILNEHRDYEQHVAAERESGGHTATEENSRGDSPPDTYSPDVELSDVRSDPAFKKKRHRYLLHCARHLSIDILYPGGQTSLDKQFAERKEKLEDPDRKTMLEKKARVERERMGLIHMYEPGHDRKLAHMYLEMGKPDRKGPYVFQECTKALAKTIEQEQLTLPPQQPRQPQQQPRQRLSHIERPIQQLIRRTQQPVQPIPNIEQFNRRLLQMQQAEQHRQQSAQSAQPSASPEPTGFEHPEQPSESPRSPEIPQCSQDVDLSTTSEPDTSMESVFDDWGGGDLSILSTSIVEPPTREQTTVPVSWVSSKMKSSSTTLRWDDVPENNDEQQVVYLLVIVEDATARMSLDKVLKSLDHCLKHYPPHCVGRCTISDSRAVPRMSCERPMAEAFEPRYILG